MIKTAAMVLFLVMCINVSGQNNKEENDFGISFGGFVKTDLIFDTRQTVSIREGHFLLYPEPESNDLAGDDLNSVSNLNMLSIQTRLSGNITAPDAFGATVSGKIEGAFFGHSNGDINGFRLRHAFVKLDWENTSLIIGQYWHPMFITEVFPGVVSFNTGVPFQPFSRNPQIRLINRFSNLFLSFTAASQRDFASTGPVGTSSSYMRNALIPMLDANLKYISGETVAGIGINYKTLKPYTELESYKVDETISSYSAIAFAKFGTDKMTIKLEGVYGTNLTDLVMLGGYSVKRIGNRGDIEYTASKTLSGWTDISFGKSIVFGLFGGYTMNLGTEDSNNGIYFSRGSNIDYVWRVSPRIQYQIQKVRFAGEVEYTTVAYGVPDENGEVLNSSDIANIRVLLAAYLFF